MKILTLNSVKGGVGKTTLAVILGRLLSQEGYPVYLLDLNLSCPMLQFILPLPKEAEDPEKTFSAILDCAHYEDLEQLTLADFKQVIHRPWDDVPFWVSPLFPDPGDLVGLSSNFWILTHSSDLNEAIEKAASFIQSEEKDKEAVLIVDNSPGLNDHASWVMGWFHREYGCTETIILSQATPGELYLSASYLVFYHDYWRRSISWLVRAVAPNQDVDSLVKKVVDQLPTKIRNQEILKKAERILQDLTQVVPLPYDPDLCGLVLSCISDAKIKQAVNSLFGQSLKALVDQIKPKQDCPAKYPECCEPLKWKYSICYSRGHPVKTAQCSKCNARFEKRIGSPHVYIQTPHHGVPEGPFQCRECWKTVLAIRGRDGNPIPFCPQCEEEPQLPEPCLIGAESH